ncbi:MAG TPA: LysR family transcriptional regulator [Myxococcota bacterium]|nr:LysR family transcriptional regulator [Myxococcota bacterium]
MDSESLRTFLAIHRAGGFSRASQALHLSQPAISRRIALLEHEVGAPLFERTAGGVALSQAGRALLPHAERALGVLEDCAAAIHALRGGATGPVSVAAVGTLASTELTPILERFAARHPGVELTLRTATSTQVSEFVRRGEATLGLRYGRDASPDVVGTALPPERLVVACGSRHRLAHKRVASLAQLAAETWLAFPNARDAREATADNVFAQFLVRGVASLRWTPVDSLTAQKRLIEAGFGLALLPESSIREECANGTLATIRVMDLRAGNPVFAIVRRGGYLSAAARDLLALLASQPLARRAGRASAKVAARAKRRAAKGSR